MSDSRLPSIFNSALETGVRSLCVLNASAEMTFDLHEMLAFDHLLVHSGDVQGGPKSLHPKVSKRNGELLVRRQLVESGLLLMESKGLLHRVADKGGINYQANDLSFVFLNTLASPYVKSLRDRAAWAVEIFSDHQDTFFEEIFNMAFSRWTTEFKYSDITIGAGG